MNTLYTGFYHRFETRSKKDAAVLLGADNLIGDVFEVVFKVEDGNTTAWLKNRFDDTIGYFNEEATNKLRLLNARGWTIKAILALVAYTDAPEPGCYWGEAALICYDPAYEKPLKTFIAGISKRFSEGFRPEIDLGEQGVQQIIDSEGSWTPAKSVPLPKKKPGTVIMKSRQKLSEKLIEQGRKGNKGCYFISWIFLLGLVAGLLFALKSCGVF